MNEAIELFQALIETLEAKRTKADRDHNSMTGEYEVAINQLIAIRRRLYG